MLDKLFTIQEQNAKKIKLDFKRYLFGQINWNLRAIAIIGSRGTGKTTLMLQHYLDEYNDPGKCLYIIGDDLEVISRGLLAIADEFQKQNGKTLIIDEIHKYPNWSQEVKNIYDRYPDLKIIISGSASLDIIKGKYDLSRRVVSYHLKGLSFREFVNLTTNLRLKPFKLRRVLKQHLDLSREITSLLYTKDKKILKLFSQYLQYGYYPFFLEGIQEYSNRLTNTLDKILYEDIPNTTNIATASVPKLSKLIHLVGSSNSFKVDITRISTSIGSTRESTYSYIDNLIKADIFVGLKSEGKAHKQARKAEKLYLNNPNLYSLIKDSSPDRLGAIRECFAANQLIKDYQVTVPKHGDLLLDEKYIFEIGGASKNKSQIKKYGSKAYILSDNIELGYKDKLPLYILGFLY